jgi:hypothetical protein
VLDFVGASTKHSLRQVTAADALGGEALDPKVRAHARRNMEAGEDPGWDVSEHLEAAQEELELLAEEEERRRRIVAQVSYRTEDAEGLTAGHALSNGTQAVPREMATPAQVRYIAWAGKRQGWTAEKAARLTKGQASGVIGRLKRESAGAAA